MCHHALCDIHHSMTVKASATAWRNSLLVQGQSVRSRQHSWHAGTDVHNVPHWSKKLKSNFHLQKSSAVEGAGFEVLAVVMHTDRGFKNVNLCCWVNSFHCFRAWQYLFLQGQEAEGD